MPLPRAGGGEGQKVLAPPPHVTAGYSVLGWNHPGFAGSTVRPSLEFPPFPELWSVSLWSVSGVRGRGVYFCGGFCSPVAGVPSAGSCHVPSDSHSRELAGGLVSGRSSPSHHLLSTPPLLQGSCRKGTGWEGTRGKRAGLWSSPTLPLPFSLQGVPFPQNEANAMDVVIQFAIYRLGFQPQDIIIYAWSIGGFTGTSLPPTHTHAIPALPEGDVGCTHSLGVGWRLKEGEDGGGISERAGRTYLVCIHSHFLPPSCLTIKSSPGVLGWDQGSECFLQALSSVYFNVLSPTSPKSVLTG